MFNCDKCGICCRNLNKSELYSDLHNGNGICKYLQGDLCSIYNDRPLLCRVDECYDLFYKALMTKDQYYKLNYKSCLDLKESGGK